MASKIISNCQFENPGILSMQIVDMYSFAIDKHNPRERDASLISRVDIVVAFAGLSELGGRGASLSPPPILAD